MRLYHVTVQLPTCDEYPGAKGEERIYVCRGWLAKKRKVEKMEERHPNCVSWRLVPLEERSPIP